MTINQATFTIPAIVAAIANYNHWENGKDTGEIEGVRIDVLFEDGFERVKIPVKIPALVKLPISPEQVAASKAKRVPIYVVFDGLEFSPYVNRQGGSSAQAYSARATGVKVVESKPLAGFGVPPATPAAKS